MAVESKTPLTRQALNERYTQSLKKKGMVRITLIVPERHKKQIQREAQLLREREKLRQLESYEYSSNGDLPPD